MIDPAARDEHTAPSLAWRNALVEANRGLVPAIARGFLGRGVDLDDLVGEGNIGLIRAAEKFDPGRGWRFSTYASWLIRRAIHEGIANTSHAVRVPPAACREVGHFRKAAGSIGPIDLATSFDEVCDAIGFPRRESTRRRLRAAVVTLDLRRAETPVEECGNLVVEPSPLIALIDAEDRDQLASALEALPADERHILGLLHGLDGSPPLTVTAAARETGRRWHDIRTIAARAVGLLRASLAD